MNILVVIILIAFSLGNLIKPSFITPELKLSPLDLCVVFIWIGFIFKAKFNIFKYFQLSNQHIYSLSAFTVVASISLFLNHSKYSLVESLVGLSYLLRWIAYSFLFIPLSNLLSATQRANLLKWIVILLPIFCIFQYLFFPDMRSLEVFNWDPHLYRVVGSFLDPGFTGFILVINLGIIYFSKDLFVSKQKLMWLLTYISLALTYSRASYLAFILSGIYISIKSKSFKYILLCAMILCISLIILPRPGGEGVKLARTSSIYARIINWSQSIYIASTSPVNGVGFNLYRYAQRDAGILDSGWQASHSGAGADSSLLFVTATTGLIGLFFYLQYIVSFKFLNHPILGATLVGLLGHSLFLNSLFYPPILFLLSLLIAYLNFFPNRIAGFVSSNKN